MYPKADFDGEALVIEDFEGVDLGSTLEVLSAFASPTFFAFWISSPEIVDGLELWAASFVRLAKAETLGLSILRRAG